MNSVVFPGSLTLKESLSKNPRLSSPLYAMETTFFFNPRVSGLPTFLISIPGLISSNSAPASSDNFAWAFFADSTPHGLDFFRTWARTSGTAKSAIPPATTGGFSATNFRTPSTKPPRSISLDPKDVKELMDCSRASSYVRAPANPLPFKTEERRAIPPPTETADFENLNGGVEGSEESFLGSVLLSEQIVGLWTETGVRPAALRTSMNLSSWVFFFFCGLFFTVFPGIGIWVFKELMERVYSSGNWDLFMVLSLGGWKLKAWVGGHWFKTQRCWVGVGYSPEVVRWKKGCGNRQWKDDICDVWMRCRLQNLNFTEISHVFLWLRTSLLFLLRSTWYWKWEAGTRQPSLYN